jgi:hypothetical protein
MPRPSRPRPRVRRNPAASLAALRGTPGQVAWAQAIRVGLLAEARRAGDLDAAAVIASVIDSSWFIANRGRPIARLRWPRADQLEPGSLADTDGGEGP